MSWYDAIREAGDAIEKLKNAEANQAMATVRMEGAKLAEENARLREENLELKATAKKRVELRYEHNVWWGIVGQVELPHCPKCWGGEERTVVLNKSTDPRFWNCPVCKFVVRRPGAVDPAPQARILRRARLRPVFLEP